MPKGEDWNIRHPVLAVVLMAAAFAVVPAVYGEWKRAGILAVGGAIFELVRGRFDRAAFQRGGIDELRHHRRRVRRWGSVALVAVLALLIWPLLA